MLAVTAAWKAALHFITMLFEGNERKERERQMRQAGRLPPGQSLTLKWPVLHYGSVPRFDPANWDFTSVGGSAPTDFFPTSFHLDTPLELYAFHAANVTFGKYFFSGTAASRELNIAVNFTASDITADPKTGGSAGFYWAGHLARGSVRCGDGDAGA